MKMKSNIHIPPEYIINTGKCKSYLGNKENNKKFFESFRQISSKNIDFFLKSIDFNIKKMKSSNISVESILSLLPMKKDKENFLYMIMNDKDINYLDRNDLDFIKEKFNGDFNKNKYFKKREYIIDELKYKIKEKKTFNLNLTPKKENRFKIEYEFKKYDLNEYLIVVKKIMNLSLSSIEEAQKILEDEMYSQYKNRDSDIIDFEKIEYSRSDSIEKIKKYSKYTEVIEDVKYNIEIFEQNHIIAELTPHFYNNITQESFYYKIDNSLPEFKKKNISYLLYKGFLHEFELCIALIGEIDYYLKLKNQIAFDEIISFKELKIDNKLVEELLDKFDVRNKVCHGIFDERSLKIYSFIIYLISLEIFMN